VFIHTGPSTKTYYYMIYWHIYLALKWNQFHFGRADIQQHLLKDSYLAGAVPLLLLSGRVRIYLDRHLYVLALLWQVSIAWIIFNICMP